MTAWVERCHTCWFEFDEDEELPEPTGDDYCPEHRELPTSTPPPPNPLAELRAKDYSYIGGSTPGGMKFGAAIGDDIMAVRVTDQACIVHPKWMTRDQICDLQGALLQLITGWDREGQ